MNTANGECYRGNFKNGKRNGSGKLSIGAYSIEGEFENNEATLMPNTVLFEMISPDLGESVVDPKAKKDPKAPAKVSRFTEEEEEKYEDKRILIEYKRGTEEEPVEPTNVHFKFRFVF